MTLHGSVSFFRLLWIIQQLNVIVLSEDGKCRKLHGWMGTRTHNGQKGITRHWQDESWNKASCLFWVERVGDKMSSGSFELKLCMKKIFPVHSTCKHPPTRIWRHASPVHCNISFAWSFSICAEILWSSLASSSSLQVRSFTGTPAMHSVTSELILILLENLFEWKNVCISARSLSETDLRMKRGEKFIFVCRKVPFQSHLDLISRTNADWLGCNWIFNFYRRSTDSKRFFTANFLESCLWRANGFSQLAGCKTIKSQTAMASAISLITQHQLAISPCGLWFEFQSTTADRNT